MKDFALFTDVSVNPVLRLGTGACLALPASFLDRVLSEIGKSEITARITVKRFENTSSTQLELKTFLWALGEQRKLSKGRLSLYTDSQCISGLLKRKSGLLARDFLSRTTNLQLRNAPLYRRFYSCHDESVFEVIKVDGHSRTSAREMDIVRRIFTIVDREARRALKLWMNELRGDRPKGMHNNDCA